MRILLWKWCSWSILLHEFTGNGLCPRHAPNFSPVILCHYGHVSDHPGLILPGSLTGHASLTLLHTSFKLPSNKWRSPRTEPATTSLWTDAQPTELMSLRILAQLVERPGPQWGGCWFSSWWVSLVARGLQGGMQQCETSVLSQWSWRNDTRVVAHMSVVAQDDTGKNRVHGVDTICPQWVRGAKWQRRYHGDTYTKNS